MIKFLQDRMKEEFWRLDPKLQAILCYQAWYAGRHGEDLYVTCLFRTQAEQAALYDAGQAPSPSSVHCFYRGADTRLLHGEHLNTLLMLEVEKIFGPYDPARPEKKVMLEHGGTALHLHSQCQDTIKEV